MSEQIRRTSTGDIDWRFRNKFNPSAPDWFDVQCGKIYDVLSDCSSLEEQLKVLKMAIKQVRQEIAEGAGGNET